MKMEEEILEGGRDLRERKIGTLFHFAGREIVTALYLRTGQGIR